MSIATPPEESSVSRPTNDPTSYTEMVQWLDRWISLIRLYESLYGRSKRPRRGYSNEMAEMLEPLPEGNPNAIYVEALAHAKRMHVPPAYLPPATLGAVDGLLWLRKRFAFGWDINNADSELDSIVVDPSPVLATDVIPLPSKYPEKPQTLLHADPASSVSGKYPLNQQEIAPASGEAKGGRRSQMRLEVVFPANEAPHFLVDGKFCSCKNELCACFLEELIKGDGRRVSFASWLVENPQFAGARLHRDILPKLPDVVRRLIDSGKGRSPRLLLKRLQ